MGAWNCFVQIMTMFKSYDKKKVLSLERCIMQSVISVFSLGNDSLISSFSLLMTDNFALHFDHVFFPHKRSQIVVIFWNFISYQDNVCLANPIRVLLFELCFSSHASSILEITGPRPRPSTPWPLVPNIEVLCDVRSTTSVLHSVLSACHFMESHNT